MGRLIRIYALLICLLLLPLSGLAQNTAATGAQTVVHMLDYIGVDYPGAVQDGKVKNEDEFKEMVEFTGQVATSLKALRANPRQSALIADGEKLARMVKEKAAAAEVAAAARKLRWDVIGAYNVTVTPKTAPDLKAGAKLYQTMCAGCHGAEGRGDGPAAVKLDPKPSNFNDRERMTNRSIFGLYNTVTLGVKGTAMSPYGQLTEDERWALALHVANFSSAAESRARGANLWKEGKGSQVFPDLVNVVTLSSNEVQERYGEEMAAIQSYLIAHPDTVTQRERNPIAFAQAKLDEAVAALSQGRSYRRAATRSHGLRRGV